MLVLKGGGIIFRLQKRFWAFDETRGRVKPSLTRDPRFTRDGQKLLGKMATFHLKYMYSQKCC